MKLKIDRRDLGEGGVYISMDPSNGQYAGQFLTLDQLDEIDKEAGKETKKVSEKISKKSGFKGLFGSGKEKRIEEIDKTIAQYNKDLEADDLKEQVQEEILEAIDRLEVEKLKLEGKTEK